MRARSTLIAVVTAIAAVGAFGARDGAAAARWTLRFSFVPQQVYQGLPAAVSVLVKPETARCSRTVHYSDGSLQKGLTPRRASSGRAAWQWTMALDAPAGPARARVSCGSSGSLSARFTVVGGTTRASKLEVTAQGFSQRPDAYDSGSTVSYGVVLDNPSQTQTAQNVTVLVNFLDEGGIVLDSAETRVGAIGAGSTFNVGGYASLPSQTAVARLEVVVQTDSFTAKNVAPPALENVHVVASRFEPDWVGEVDGDLINDRPTDTLTNAQLSFVLYDATGEVIGGGTGFLFATLPPGTRSYFSATSGFSAIPYEDVSTVAVSVVPDYKALGA
jgi:hypothetical protein